MQRQNSFELTEGFNQLRIEPSFNSITSSNSATSSGTNYSSQLIGKDLSLEIFKFSSGKDLATLACTCKTFNTLLNDPSLFSNMPVFANKLYINQHNRYLYQPMCLSLHNGYSVFAKHSPDVFSLAIRDLMGVPHHIKHFTPLENFRIDVLGILKSTQDIACTFAVAPNDIHVFDKNTLEMKEVRINQEIVELCQTHIKYTCPIEKYDFVLPWDQLTFTDTETNSTQTATFDFDNRIEGISKIAPTLFAIKSRKHLYVYDTTAKNVRQFDPEPKRLGPL
jgi:hypothetical protein